MATKYGVISDVHNDPRIVPLAIEVLKKLGAEKLILNGDIGERQSTLQASQGYVAQILDAVGKSGLEAYVQPGSHETLLGYGPVIEYFADEYSNIIDVLRSPKVSNNGHDLVFIPGSDFSCGGEYQIGNHPQLPTGRYIETHDSLIKFDDFAQYVGALQQGIVENTMQYANMGDLRNLVGNPEKTVVVCHVPRKFDGNDAVDIAYFAEQADGKVLSGIVVENGIRQKFGNVSESDLRIIAAANGLTFKNENRGNADLSKLYEELGITKAVSGHFHESGHKAHDSSVNAVKEGELVDELYWNSGQLDLGMTGILTVDGNRVSYRNVQLKDFLR